jgi:hypothetical protein
MKKLILFALIGFTYALQAQDSTQVKLGQYKKLRELGVISEDEFIQDSAKLFNVVIVKKEEPKEEKIRKADTMSLAALKDRYKARVTAGTIITSVGGAFIVGDLLFVGLAHKLNPLDSNYNDEVRTRRGSQIALGVIGGVAAVGGSIFIALGLKDKVIYRNRNKTLTMDFNGREIGLVYNF